MENIIDIKVSKNVEVKFQEIFKKSVPESLNIDELIMNSLFYQAQDFPDKNNFK